MALLVVAEDDDDIRAIITRLLRGDGHTVIETVNGADALQEIQKHRPEAVVSDIDMPRMSGIELCRAIRSNPESKHVPVILASGSLLPGDQRPMDAGATAFVLKPFRRRQLLACLGQALATGHQEGQSPTACS
jgi:CheY-like chemotaxis protein